MTKHVSHSVTPLQSTDPSDLPFTCLYCGTLLALVGTSTTAGFLDAAVALRRRVWELRQGRQNEQPRAPLVAYMLVRGPKGEAGMHLREVWPAEPSRMVSANDWTTVPHPCSRASGT